MQKVIFIVIILIFFTGNSTSQIQVPLEARQTHKTLARKIQFSGMSWFVKAGHYGPGPNYWSDSAESVWLDAEGKLHLKIRKIDGKWYCPEIYSEKLTTYGEHRFLVEGALDQLDKNVVLGLFTYVDDTHEIDIEFSKWGSANHQKPGSFTVQPYTISGNSRSFEVKLTTLQSTHLFNWQPNFVLFSSYQGHHTDLLPAPDLLIHQWLYFGSSIPKDVHNLRTHINFWLVDGQAPVDERNLEIVIHQVLLPGQEDSVAPEKPSDLPENFNLFQIFPNPASASMTINFQLKTPEAVSLEIFDLCGKNVMTIFKNQWVEGRYQAIHTMQDLPSGVYFCQLKGKSWSRALKLLHIH
ncbi:T9SS type A sorting domain-containing protein [candidate division KSB1 bacterium]|nr:T9SS type A sorting domain-containing protein [candidate division KSB1 bacterium]